VTRTGIRAGLALCAALAVLAAAAGTADAMTLAGPFTGLQCSQESGVWFCQGGYKAPSAKPPDPGFDRRIATFDGTPLDVDVTVPGTGSGPWPTIVFIHGWGDSKTSFEAPSPAGTDNNTYHYNNVYYAQRGYAVLNYTARGWGDSCGSTASRTSACTDPTHHSWIHLDDRAFEARDAQHLLGLLVDAGIAKPNTLAATGISYGGGLSLELAYLRDRVAERPVLGGPETLVPWTSPAKHIPMSLAAAYPRWMWSDLVSSLVPNGRFLDFEPSTDGLSRTPVGIPIQSYIEGLYALGATGGFYAPPGVDPGADLTTWHARTTAGDPYTDSEVQAILNEIYAYHQAYGLGGTPAPLLVQDGWTDDLFPPQNSLRTYNSLRQANPNANIAIQFGDLGHARGSNKFRLDSFFQDQASGFFDRYLKGSGAAPAAGSVTAFTETCPRSVPDGGPYSAPSWVALHPGAFRFSQAGAQTVTSNGGNPATGAAFDPIAGGGDACKSVADETAAGTAVYRSPKVTRAFTMVGLPTVTANVVAAGSEPQLDSRLWDVTPSGQQTLISRGGYRLAPGQTSVTFQLNGNGWRFEPGHVAKLELLGQDAPYLQPNKEAFSLSVTNVVVELPTVERPGATPQIVAPTIGRPARHAARRIRLIVHPARVRRGHRVRFWFTAEYRARGRWRPLAGVLVRFDGHRMRTGRRGRATAVVRPRRAGRLRVVATRRGYVTAVRFVRVRR
jgi:pimeloyl-ACP methyl ester carboxylesterase